MNADLNINFAKVVIANNGKAMVAIRAAGLPVGESFELRLHPDKSFEIVMNGNRIGHIQETPVEALRALAAAPSVILAEIGPDGPVQFHDRVSVIS